MHPFSNQLVGKDALLRLFRVEIALLLGNLFVCSLSLSYGPRIPKVRVLVRVDRIVPPRLSYLSAQSLKFLFAPHIAPLLGLKEGTLAHKLHQVALLVVDCQVGITQGLLELRDLLLRLLD